MFSDAGRQFRTAPRHIGNQRGDARNLVVAERNRPAQVHYEDAEAGHVRLLKQLLEVERIDEKRWPARAFAGMRGG